MKIQISMFLSYIGKPWYHILVRCKPWNYIYLQYEILYDPLQYSDFSDYKYILNLDSHPLKYGKFTENSILVKDHFEITDLT